MGPEDVQAIAAVAALIIAAVALIVAARSGRDTRTQLITDLRQGWEDLGDDWASTLLLWDAGRTYYSHGSVTERQRVAALVDRFNREGEYIADPLFELRAESVHVRRVARFFAYSSDAVLRGKLSVDDVYAVFGPDVARHHQAALWVAGRESIRSGRPTFYDARSSYPVWATYVDEITERNFADEQASIVLLLWLCAGVQAVRGDTSAHLLIARARHFHDSNEWRRVRRSVASLSRARHRSPWRPLLIRKLGLAAMVPKSRATDRTESPLFDRGDEKYARGGLRRQIRKMTNGTT